MMRARNDGDGWWPTQNFYREWGAGVPARLEDSASDSDEPYNTDTTKGGQLPITLPALTAAF